MVQEGITRRTFEKKEHEADKNLLSFERTICALVKLCDNNTEKVAEYLGDMLGLDQCMRVWIRDESTWDEYPVFASMRQVCDYVSMKGFRCSGRQLMETCANCEKLEGSEECLRQRHVNCIFVMVHIKYGGNEK